MMRVFITCYNFRARILYLCTRNIQHVYSKFTPLRMLHTKFMCVGGSVGNRHASSLVVAGLIHATAT